MASTQDVIDAFIKGYAGVHTARAGNGYYRSSTEYNGHRSQLELYSYGTVIAVRKEIDGKPRIFLNTRKYSVTTSKLQTYIFRSLAFAGYRETGEAIEEEAKVPGRWYGAGPAWHPTGWETLPFTEYKQYREDR